MRFMLLMIPHGSATATTDTTPDPAKVAAMMQYNKALQQAGVLLALDGPFAEAQEVVGGYWIIQVRSREEAIEWAKRCPASPTEVIEVRQIQDFDDFSADVQAIATAAGFAEQQSQAGAQAAR